MNRPTDEPTALTEPEDFSEAMKPYFESFESLRFDHQARLAEHTQITESGQHSWDVLQVLLDPEEENLWCIEGTVDLSDDANVEGPLVTVQRIGT